MMEYTEVLFLSEDKGTICRRVDSFLLTSPHGQTLIQIDLNAVGTFFVKPNLSE